MIVWTDETTRKTSDPAVQAVDDMFGWMVVLCWIVAVAIAAAV